MSLYSSPPPLHNADDDKPTLLVCWWITLFCATIILLRVAGRFIRSEKLFREDRTVTYAVIPLFIRMGLVHLVLLWGTNNAEFTWPLTETEKRHKSIASGLVIASRILYTATLWILKLAILDFFKRTSATFWRRSHDIALNIMRGLLALTFIAILAAILTECRPFNHYYQVLPDPGGQCRQGYVQLITMATSNIMTDLFLVILPVPIILTSSMGPKKKFQLTLLFTLSLGPVATTIYRVIYVFRTHGSQQTRSLVASVELLFATTAANALVLGSFVRDRGTKKIKYRADSVAGDSLERTPSRRPTIHRHWGSDEDLVRDVGLGVTSRYRDEEEPISRLGPAPMASMNDWQFVQPETMSGRRENAIQQQDQMTSSGQSNSTNTPRRVSFLDVGGLLDSETSDTTLRSTRNSFNSSQDPLSPYRTTPSPTMIASGSGFRRGSQTLLQDLGGLFHPFQPRRTRTPSGGELQPIPQHPHEPAYEMDEYRGGPILVDAGGLLR
ncbi:GPCR protein, PTH11-type [Xylaria bambusicola]|uniref:GPCR protein, PTH11-type n=1 Tax=Xylaria bambusicola TaxID=326684 RepID=UPI0020081CB2|nr:GPCR protein, PTH11-type [Xylaria bambusicola]KAI0509256.1 GPCR protein, PTH11-type [Xylaria bambusicola]